MPNYATKAELKNATGIDASSFAKKVDLASLKFNVDKLDIDKLKNVPTYLSNLKSKVEKLVPDKLLAVPVDLSKLSDVMKNYAVKKDAYNAKIRRILFSSKEGCLFARSTHVGTRSRCHWLARLKELMLK